MTRLLGVDHGLKRIGLAVSDPSGLVARELAVIHRTTNREDFDRINRIAQEQQAAAIVVGLPDNDYRQPGEPTQADTVRRWAERFAAAASLPVILWDEQLTTVDAQEIAGRRKRSRREPIDDLAARVMLQSYLDALRDGLAALPPSVR